MACSKPIDERSYAKTIFFDTRVKTTLSTSSLRLRMLAYTSTCAYALVKTNKIILTGKKPSTGKIVHDSRK